MSAEGGDGIGPSGGGGKGEGGNANPGGDLGGGLPYTPEAGGSLDQFVSNPTGNLSAPGPVGGDAGMPGAGGGSNTPFAWGDAFDNLPNLNGVDPNSFVGGDTPIASGGVSSSALDAGTSPTADTSSFDNLVNGNANPAAASAAGTAAPAGVTGNTDVASDFSSANKVTAPTSGASATSGSSNPVSDFTKSLGISNPLGTGIAGIGLLNSLINGNKPLEAAGGLNTAATSASATAAQQTSAGQALQQWQTTGTLPASYESQVQQAADAAKQRAISNAAAQGLPTDATRNTALAQQLQAIDAAVPGQREAIAAQLAQSGQAMVNAGLTATGISSGVYQTLANLENSRNQQRGAAIANFAGALNGGANKGLTLKVA